jgi:hypothetical protein
MSARSLRLTCLVSVLLCAAASAPAQEGHPASGVWVGHWGPTLTAQSRVVVVMNHDGKTMSGVLNPGPNAVPLKGARLDITPGKPSPGKNIPGVMPIFKVYFEVDAKDATGNPVGIVAEGTMNNVGLPNRWIGGTWTQTSGGNATKSEFKITRQ